MSINTGHVKNRREVAFESLDDVLMEAERLVAAANVKMLGNWELGQILGHLALGLHRSMDGMKARPPWYVRLIGPFLRGRMLRRMPAGYRLSRDAEKELWPQELLTPQQGLERLRDAVKRFRSDTQRVPHFVFGKLTGAQWHQFHLRHAEMHLSFVLTEL